MKESWRGLACGTIVSPDAIREVERRKAIVLARSLEAKRLEVPEPLKPSQNPSLRRIRELTTVRVVARHVARRPIEGRHD